MAIVQNLDSVNRGVIMKLKQIHSDPLIKLKKYTDAYTGVGAGLDKNGFPVTGLTEDIVEFKGNTKKIIKRGTRVIMEKELDLVEGTLKNTNSEYWAKFFVRVGADPVELNLSSPHELLQYLFCKAQSIVADSQAEIKTNSKVEYVLYSEEEEAKTRVENRKSLKAAYRLAEDLDLETQVNILAVYGLIADATSPNAIVDKIDEKIEDDPSRFLEIAQDGNLVARSLVTKALDKGVFLMKDGAIWHEEVKVGYDKDDAAKALQKDSTLQAIVKAKISGDMELIQAALNPSKK